MHWSRSVVLLDYVGTLARNGIPHAVLARLGPKRLRAKCTLVKLLMDQFCFPLPLLPQQLFTLDLAFSVQHFVQLPPASRFVLLCQEGFLDAGEICIGFGSRLVRGAVEVAIDEMEVFRP